MHPVHSFKRRISSATSRREVTSSISGEYLDYKQRLAQLHASLIKLMAKANEVPAAWDRVFQLQRDFCATAESQYPANDALKARSTAASEKMYALGRKLSKHKGNQCAFDDIKKQVRAFLLEVERVQKEYPPVERSFSEFVRYQKKCDKLEAKKERKQNKILRNLDKKDESRAAYQEKLNSLVERMKIVYAKHPVVYKMLVTAFWLHNTELISMVTEGTKAMCVDAAVAENFFADVDIAQPSTFAHLIDGLPDNSLPLKAGDTPGSPASIVLPSPPTNIPAPPRVVQIYSTTNTEPPAPHVSADMEAESSGTSEANEHIKKKAEKPTPA